MGAVVRQRGVSEDEFTVFYTEYKDRCLRAVIASGMAPDRAEDAVAEAFARAWSRWSTVRKAAAPAAWVFRTAVNANISWWRKRRHEVVADQLPEGWLDSLSENESAAEVLAAVRKLPPRQREVVVLRYLLDLDTAATASHLGIAQGTVRAHLHQAIASLRELLTSPEGISS
jgi:RNA polymerase sigma-70 factor (ECF subfamily)